jgi:hypothetical protein
MSSSIIARMAACRASKGKSRQNMHLAPDGETPLRLITQGRIILENHQPRRGVGIALYSPWEMTYSPTAAGNAKAFGMV